MPKDDLDTKIASGSSADSLETGKETAANGAISDLDFSDVPEKDREAVKVKTAEKVKQYQSGYTKKSQELADKKKDLEAKEKSLD